MQNKNSHQSINPNALKFLNKQKSKTLSLSDLKSGISNGDRYILSKAITLIESNQIDDKIIASELIDYCVQKNNNALRIGITGTPGVGKSTFIDALGSQIISENHKLAVLAIDPSSSISKGSILGDKTRMEKLSQNLNAYIRPSASAKNLGGVARKTRETMLLCEAAGFDTIIIETVGVGQSETTVYQLSDLFLLLLQPGAGDELQGIKRGIMEMADIIAINKYDGERLQMAKQAKAAYTSALHLFQPKASNWIPKVITCSALENVGILELWKDIKSYHKLIQSNKFLDEKRNQQNLYWFKENLQQRILSHFYEHQDIANQFKMMELNVLQSKISPFNAVDELMLSLFS